MVADALSSDVITYLARIINRSVDIEKIRVRARINSPGFRTKWYKTTIKVQDVELSERDAIIAWAMFFPLRSRRVYRQLRPNKYYLLHEILEDYLGEESTPSVKELESATTSKNQIKSHRINSWISEQSVQDRVLLRGVFSFIPRFVRPVAGYLWKGRSVIDRQVAPRKRKELGYQIIEVYYSTDRQCKKKGQDVTFPGEPNVPQGPPMQSLSYGVCKVSIPNNHQVGRLESALVDLLKMPGRYITLLRVEPMSREMFLPAILNSASNEASKQAFIFIHGYNTKFAVAAKRTAQIYYDLKFNGVPIFYSWPSKARIDMYSADEESAKWSVQNLEFFIKEFLDSTEVENLYLIGHSMGNRVLTEAVMSLLSKNPTYGSRIREVILAAPDIDVRVFKRDIVPALAQHSNLTLYASSKDRALSASKGRHKTPRAGEAGEGIVLMDGLDTIDASIITPELFALGHSYNFTKRSMLNDMSELIKGLRPSQRFELEAVTDSTHLYWKLRK